MSLEKALQLILTWREEMLDLLVKQRATLKHTKWDFKTKAETEREH